MDPTNNDSSQAYRSLASQRERANSDQARFEELKAHLGEKLDPPPEAKAKPEAESAFMKTIKEIPVQSLGGGLEAVQEMGNTAIMLTNSIDGILNKMGITDEDPILKDQNFSFANDMFPDAETPLGGMARGITQFLLPMGMAMKTLKAIPYAARLPHLVQGALAGAAADFAAFDPQEQRLSNLIQEFPILSNSVADYFSAKPDDSDAEGRFKNAIEGLGLGALTDATMLGFRAYKQMRGLKKAPEAVPPAATTKALGEPEVKPAAVDPELGAPVTDPALPPPPVEGKPVAEFAPSPDNVRVEMDPDDFMTVVDAADGSGKAMNVTLNKIRSEQDIKKLIQTQAELNRGAMEGASRGVRTDEAVRRMATALAMKPEVVERILKRRLGEAFNAEEIEASRKVLVMATSNLLDMAKKATGEGATDLSRANFMDALNVQRAIQMQVTGAIAEAGRALRVMRNNVSVKGLEGHANEIKDIIQLAGGQDGIDKIAARIAELAEKPAIESTEAVSKILNRSLGSKMQDAVFEVWVNGLLSRPSTHLVNILSNSSAIVAKMAERSVGEVLSRRRGLIGEDQIAAGEGAAVIMGAIEGFRDSMRLAWEAIKRGQARDIVGKLETGHIPAISGQAFNQSGVIGTAIDVFGEVVRTPGRALVGADEFFKSLNFRMELQALAVRDSVGKGLTGDAMKANIDDILKNPPDKLKAAATREARVGTFTKPLEGGFAHIDKAVKAFPPLRFVAPFIRTPINLFEYTLERSPLGLASPRIRAELKAGGARRDMAIAKLSVGSSVMATSGLLAAGGMITGQGPRNPEDRKLLELTGWRPNSIKVGDTYVSYNRLDPFGKILGMAADIVEIGGTALGTDQEQDWSELGMTSVATIAQNYTPEFLAENMHALTLLMDRRGEGQEKLADSYIGSTVPGWLQDVRKMADPVRRDVEGDPRSEWGYFDEMANRIKGNLPYFSESLPPKLNLFGERIPFDPGVPLDSVSAVAYSQEKDDKVLKELVRLNVVDPFYRHALPDGESTMRLSMPSRKITASNMASVEMNPQEYHDFVKFSAGIGLKGEPTLKKALAFTLERYAHRSDELKRREIMLQVRKYRGLAKEAMIQSGKYPELTRRLRAAEKATKGAINGF